MFRVVRNEKEYQRRRRVAVVLAAMASGTAAFYMLNVVAPIPAEPPTVDCQEDEPCWDCSTMGNGVCGPLTLDDGYIIDARGKMLGVVAEP